MRGRRLPLCAWRFQTAGLSAKSDLGFTEAVFALLPRIYAYRPTLSAVQFLRKGFAEQKMRLVGDVVKLVSKDERDHRAKVLLAENINPALQKASMRRYFVRLGFQMLGGNRLGSEIWVRRLNTHFSF